jgi:hypothetical protein
VLRLITVLLLAVLAAAGYTAYAGVRVYQDLGSGRDHLIAGQADLAAAVKTGDLATLRTAATELEAADADFRRGSVRLRTDPALLAGARVSASQEQVAAVIHLAAIGDDMAQAGSAAEQIAEGVVTLRQSYAGRTLIPTELAALAHDADALAQRYAAAAVAIEQQLRLAHHERAQVVITALVPPLRAAYDQVDMALAAADEAFRQFQDPKGLLSQFFGLTLPP